MILILSLFVPNKIKNIIATNDNITDIIARRISFIMRY